MELITSYWEQILIICAAFIDAIRLAKIALDRGLGGPIIPASAYLMKHPIQQMTDPIAKTEIENFVKGE